MFPHLGLDDDVDTSKFDHRTLVRDTSAFLPPDPGALFDEAGDSADLGLSRDGLTRAGEAFCVVLQACGLVQVALSMFRDHLAHGDRDLQLRDAAFMHEQLLKRAVHQVPFLTGCRPNDFALSTHEHDSANGLRAYQLAHRQCREQGVADFKRDNKAGLLFPGGWSNDLEWATRLCAGAKARLKQVKPVFDVWDPVVGFGCSEREGVPKGVRLNVLQWLNHSRLNPVIDALFARQPWAFIGFGTEAVNEVHSQTEVCALINPTQLTRRERALTAERVLDHAYTYVLDRGHHGTAQYKAVTALWAGGAEVALGGSSSGGVQPPIKPPRQPSAAPVSDGPSRRAGERLRGPQLAERVTPQTRSLSATPHLADLAADPSNRTGVCRGSTSEGTAGPRRAAVLAGSPDTAAASAKKETLATANSRGRSGRGRSGRGPVGKGMDDRRSRSGKAGPADAAEKPTAKAGGAVAQATVVDGGHTAAAIAESVMLEVNANLDSAGAQKKRFAWVQRCMRAFVDHVKPGTAPPRGSLEMFRTLFGFSVTEAASSWEAVGSWHSNSAIGIEASRMHYDHYITFIVSRQANSARFLLAESLANGLAGLGQNALPQLRQLDARVQYALATPPAASVEARLYVHALQEIFQCSTLDGLRQWISDNGPQHGRFLTVWWLETFGAAALGKAFLPQVFLLRHQDSLPDSSQQLQLTDLQIVRQDDHQGDTNLCPYYAILAQWWAAAGLRFTVYSITRQQASDLEHWLIAALRGSLLAQPLATNNLFGWVFVLLHHIWTLVQSRVAALQQNGRWSHRLTWKDPTQPERDADHLPTIIRSRGRVPLDNHTEGGRTAQTVAKSVLDEAYAAMGSPRGEGRSDSLTWLERCMLSFEEHVNASPGAAPPRESVELFRYIIGLDSPESASLWEAVMALHSDNGNSGLCNALPQNYNHCVAVMIRKPHSAHARYLIADSHQDGLAGLGSSTLKQLRQLDARVVHALHDSPVAFFRTRLRQHALCELFGCASVADVLQWFETHGPQRGRVLSKFWLDVIGSVGLGKVFLPQVFTLRRQTLLPKSSHLLRPQDLQILHHDDHQGATCLHPYYTILALLWAAAGVPFTAASITRQQASDLEAWLCTAFECSRAAQPPQSTNLFGWVFVLLLVILNLFQVQVAALRRDGQLSLPFSSGHPPSSTITGAAAAGQPFNPQRSLRPRPRTC